MAVNLAQGYKRSLKHLLVRTSLFVIVFCFASSRPALAGCGDYLIPLGSPAARDMAAHPGMPSTESTLPTGWSAGPASLASNTPWDTPSRYPQQTDQPCHGPHCGQAPQPPENAWGVMAPPRVRTQSTLVAACLTGGWTPLTVDWRSVTENSRCDYQTDPWRLLRPPRVI